MKKSKGQKLRKNDTPRPTEAKCRVCGCTDERACPVGCSWIKADLCSVCAEFGEALYRFMDSTWHPSLAGIQRLYREILESGRR